MRPVSDIRLGLQAALVDGPGTSRELAQRICAGRQAVTVALDNMVRAGDVAKLPRPVRVPGVKRPVPVYARPQAADAGPVQSLLACWAAQAVQQQQEAAM